MSRAPIVIAVKGLRISAGRSHAHFGNSIAHEAHEASALPDDPPNEDELDAWLIEVRRAMF
ncbi:MAG: hypothetical protein Q8S73_45095 [Deltaproteobacteria bacterium]|nr:hypothetical protein [Myxococcales bacterium]MDP3221345.1 hypothetical protein [Deltaproteobacteria bacterium]